MNTFSAQILTPEGSVFDDEVLGVRVPGEMGSFEVKTLHANIISSLDVGEIILFLRLMLEKSLFAKRPVAKNILPLPVVL